MSHKTLSIDRIVERLTGTRDLFADTVAERYVVEAGKKWLESRGDGMWKAEILQQHANDLAEAGYYGLAAQLATEASLEVARRDFSYTSTWEQCVSATSVYWDASGRLDEKQSVFLRLSGIGIRAGKQLSLFSKRKRDHPYRPVWILAQDFHRDSEFAQSATVYETLFLETLAHEDYTAAGKAALNAAFEYAHLGSWSEGLDRACTAIEVATKETAYNELIFHAHVLAGICLFRMKERSKLKEALRYLVSAKRVLRKWKTRAGKKAERKLLYYSLGRAYAAHGLDLMDNPGYRANKALQYQIEYAYKQATDYLVKADDSREFIGECFAIRAAIARLLGDAERATMLEATAIAYGYAP